MLFVSCPNCKKDFPSIVQVDRASFYHGRIENISSPCPHCDKQVTYSKKDMEFK